MNYTLKEIASVADGVVVGDQYIESEVRNILFDSRLFVEADNTLFFALKGAHNDGHKYVDELYDKGVRMFVVDRSFSNFIADASFVVVSTPLPHYSALPPSTVQGSRYPSSVSRGAMVRPW